MKKGGTGVGKEARGSKEFWVKRLSSRESLCLPMDAAPRLADGNDLVFPGKVESFQIWLESGIQDRKKKRGLVPEQRRKLPAAEGRA